MRRHIAFLVFALLFATSTAVMANPGPVCSAGELGRAGVASLLFFNFDEDLAYVNVAQGTLPLHIAMQGYERVVLLADESKLQHNPRAIAEADLVAAPTREALVAQLRSLVHDGYAVDLWILAHGNKTHILAKGKDLGARFVERQLSTARTGCHQLPIRMVYQMNCWGSAFNPVWQRLGAQVTMGSREVNFFPTQFSRFARAWRGGATFEQAVKLADHGSTRTPVYAYITADSLARQGSWTGCAWKGVLGNSSCAKSYFADRWSTSWRGTGKRTMKYASKKLIAGNGGLSRSTTLHWE